MKLENVDFIHIVILEKRREVINYNQTLTLEKQLWKCIFITIKKKLYLYE